jgi:hypothetical protein
MPRNSTKENSRPESAPRVHSDTYMEFIRNVKNYEVIELDDKWGTLRCPKKDCKGEFKVIREKFKDSKPSIGRSCPYCFRTSALPGAEVTAEGMNRGRVNP